jgi:peroxiredoxin
LASLNTSPRAKVNTMAAVNSTMLDLGSTAPDFQLSDYNGNRYSLSDMHSDKGLLVVFWCNHCPYVKKIRDRFVVLTTEWVNSGLDVVAIMSNDAVNYPDDAPDKMKIEAETYRYPYPYLIDETQHIAHAYKAACTPDFYLFDGDKKLVYRGQFDGSRPKNDIPVTGEDLAEAVGKLMRGDSIPKEQYPSIGCNIKWKAGNEPEYFTIHK